MFWSLLKSFFFLFNPERAHYLSMNLFSVALKIPILSYFLKKSFTHRNNHLEKTVDGIVYKNPIGLAAGFDKDGKWLHLLSSLGFGFIEVGTVTPKPQVGNNKPRLFRLIKDLGIINRMGFNNEGVDALISRLKKFNTNKKVIIGGNIGKNKNTPNEDAINDYLFCFEKLFHYVDYFVINVSSPNTPNLRNLQDKEPLFELLSQIQLLNKSYSFPKPIYLKIAPDLNNQALSEIIDVVINTKINGIVATNTTIQRPSELKEIDILGEQGGLSGLPVQKLSNKILTELNKNKQFTIISVGGVVSVSDVIFKFNHGADLVQIYSGLIYEGPWFIKKILNSLSKLSSKELNEKGS